MSTTSPFTVTVNGTRIDAMDGDSILSVILKAEPAFPHICHHPSLGAIETCDTCIARVNGKLIRACSTTVQPDIIIETAHAAAEDARTEAMNRILANHELYCTVCDNNNGNCTVHNTAAAMGIEHQSVPFTPKPYAEDNSHPFYRYDPNQCILCGRCVEACQDLQVSEVLSIDWAREHPRVIWDHDVPAGESSCVSCGHCVSVCPCNALMEKPMLGEAGFLTSLKPSLLTSMIDLTKSIEPGYGPIFTVSNVEAKMRESRIQKAKTVCTYCGVGCSFEVWTKGRDILKIEPNVDAPANGISTCIKGKFGWDFVNSEDRLTTPLIRRGDRFVPATWDEALDLMVEKLDGIRNAYGSDAVGFISSSKCTNEENYLMQKLARQVFGTNNIDNCSRYCQSPATTALRRTMGYGGDSGSIADLAAADLVIIVGANPAESHPVLSTRIRRAQKLHGQKLIVADLRKNGMAERADVFLHPTPGSDLVWLSAVTKIIIDNGWQNEAFIREQVTGFNEFATSLETFTPAYAAAITGIPKETLQQVARMIHEAGRLCICWAMGVTQHMGGSDTSTAICNLLLTVGQVGRPGSGAYPLRGHNNVQGAGDFGCAPDVFPGYESVLDASVRQRYEAAWQTQLPQHRGYDNHQMVDAMHRGDLKGLYLMGEEMALVDTNANHVQAAFEKLDFFVVQDIFFSRTAQFADVVLPAAPSLEKDGTFTSTERRIQRLYQVLSPLGDSKPDWQILCMFAKRMGTAWNYGHPSEIFAEATAIAPMFGGATYERLEGYQSLQWPIQASGEDAPLLYTDGFPLPGGKARFYPVGWSRPTHEPNAEYDLHLNNGRMLEHFHEGNLTYRVAGIREKVPTVYVELSPELADQRQIKDGAVVRLVSPYGAVKVPVVVTSRVQGNELYLPMNSREAESAINHLTSNETDAFTHTPAYKELPVRMEVLRDGGKSPMAKGNFRLGNPNPQVGVNVAEKWRRSDYHPLVTTGSDVTWEEGSRG